MDTGQKNILRCVVHRVGYPADVVDHAGHQLSGLAVVEEAKGKGLQMAEEVAAHILLHLHCHQVSRVEGVEIAPVLHQHHQGNQQTQLEYGFQVPGGNQRIQALVGSYRRSILPVL